MPWKGTYPANILRNDIIGTYTKRVETKQFWKSGKYISAGWISFDTIRNGLKSNDWTYNLRTIIAEKGPNQTNTSKLVKFYPIWPKNGWYQLIRSRPYEFSKDLSWNGKSQTNTSNISIISGSEQFRSDKVRGRNQADMSRPCYIKLPLTGLQSEKQIMLW